MIKEEESTKFEPRLPGHHALALPLNYDAQLCFHEKNKTFPCGFVPQLFLSLKLHLMLKVLGTKIKYMMIKIRY